MISKKSFYIPAYQVSFFEGRLKDSEHTVVQNENKYLSLWKISWYKQFSIRYEVQDNEAVFKTTLAEFKFRLDLTNVAVNSIVDWRQFAVLLLVSFYLKILDLKKW